MSLTVKQVELLFTNGYVSLPQYKISEKKKLSFMQSVEQSEFLGYQSNFSEHQKYTQESGIEEVLAKQLKDLAQQYFNYRCDINDIYRITRKITSSQISEHFRFHFDSHLFTLVTPINIPSSTEQNKGELILAPLLRKEPINELKNAFTKIYFKKYANIEGFKKLNEKKILKFFDFRNEEPLLFLGRCCYHANNKFTSLNNEKRITILTHFFDPSPTISLGRLMRFIRNR